MSVASSMRLDQAVCYCMCCIDCAVPQQARQARGNTHMHTRPSLAGSLAQNRLRSEQELFQDDQALHAFRTVGRMLSAGQPFSYVAMPKKTCLGDNVRLLGEFVGDIRDFPVWGGREFIAGAKL